MDGGGLKSAVRYLRSLFEADPRVGVSDEELIERFVAHRESAALESLVLRHGPMVWGVCRRILRDHHDIEDAFQATFLVLARRAEAITPRRKVGNWLYGVAYQTAMKARATKAKRRRRESAVANLPEPESAATSQRNDLAELLDGELKRLPDRYRTPIVLCELEGLTHGEAAERLGCPIGTVSGRLSRARTLLAKRLTQRGATAGGVVLAALFTEQQATASAEVSAQLLSATVKAAIEFAAKQTKAATIVSAEVANLTTEVLKTMRTTRIKIVAAVLATFLLAGAGIWQARTWADGKSSKDGTFHATVTNVVNDDSVIVTRIEIDTPPGSKIEVFSDTNKRGNYLLSSDSPGSAGPDGNAHFELIVLGDHVETKDHSANIVKFMLAYRVGGISGSTSDADPFPANAKQLSDILTVPIKSGDYQFGTSTKVATFKGATYIIVVTKPN